MSKQTEIFEFDDVDLVRGLCGPNHANLALIEEAFGVYIEAPGASVHINGDTPSRARAGELVKEIYQRLERGWPCCLLYTSPSPRDATLSRMPSSA